MRYYQSEKVYVKYKTQLNRQSFFAWLKHKKRGASLRSAQTNVNFYQNKTAGNAHKKLYIISSSLVIFLLIWGGLLIYLPYFKIDDVQINGLGLITRNEAEEILNNYWSKLKKIAPSNNYFLTNTQTIADNFKTKFSLKDIIIRKIFPNKLQITIYEKLSSVIYYDRLNYYLLDVSGTPLKQLSVPTLYISSTSDFLNATGTPLVKTPNINYIKNTYGKNYPIIYFSSTSTIDNIFTTSTFLNKNIISGIINFVNTLAKEGSGIKVNYFEIKNLNTGAKVYSNKPYTIYFEPLNDITEQISKLTLITANNQPKEYINLRYNDRIFWK